MEKTIDEKIMNGQEHITTNYDLRKYGYSKHGRENGKIKWEKLGLQATWKQKIRTDDKNFFYRSVLGAVYMKDKVIHHNWDSWDCWVQVLDKNEHPNGGKEKTTRLWIEKEEWYE